MWVGLAAFGISLTAVAQHTGHEPLPAAATELYPGLGDYHFPITTSNPDAQVYFDEGVRLLYGFNDDEAARYFCRAAELDPRAAGNYTEAEQTFRDALATHPRDGRLLYGLWQTLAAQGRDSEAVLVEGEFSRAWRHATQPLTLDDL